MAYRDGENGDDSDKWQKRKHYRHEYTPDSYAQKKAFRQASNNLGFAGFAGHLVRTGGVLVPLLVGEFIPDPDKKWKAIRLSAVAVAVLSEALYAYEHRKGKQASREDDAEAETRLRSAFAGDSSGALGVGR